MIDTLVAGGGTENQLVKLISGLNRGRFEPYLIILRPKDELSIELDCPVKYLNVKSLKSCKGITAIFKLSRWLKREEIDILQMFYFDSRFIGTLAARIAKVKRVIYSRREMGWWYTPFKLKVARFLAARCDACLANSEAVKKMVTATEKFPPGKIKVIYNGVDLQAPANGQRISRSDLNIPDDALLVGIVANLRPVKRLDRFIEAAALINRRDVHYLIVGQGDLRTELENLAVQKGLADTIHFYHTVKDIANILDLIDIAVLTSESEGLSNVLIEYALAGIPAVAFDVGGNREIIRDSHTGYILPPGDTEALAGRIAELLNNREMRQIMGAEAHEFAGNTFSVDEMVRTTQSFYLQLLDHSK